jgi:hypothetical protein
LPPGKPVHPQGDEADRQQHHRAELGHAGLFWHYFTRCRIGAVGYEQTPPPLPTNLSGFSRAIRFRLKASNKLPAFSPRSIYTGPSRSPNSTGRER